MQINQFHKLKQGHGARWVFEKRKRQIAFVLRMTMHQHIGPPNGQFLAPELNSMVGLQVLRDTPNSGKTKTRSW